MLRSISEYNRADALMLLRWVTYAQSPRTLHELAEATIIEIPDETGVEGAVDMENLGGWADTLSVLTGLVTIQDEEEDREDGSRDREHIDRRISTEISQDAKVRLAHFSVQEFLESTRILASDVDAFHLDPAREHSFLARSCLVYLHHYSSSTEKDNSWKDFDVFPLVRYASKAWFYHTSFEQRDESHVLAISLLTSEDGMRDSLAIHQPDRSWKRSFETSAKRLHVNGLYYASYLGFGRIARRLLNKGVDVNAQGGHYGNALQAASYRGYTEIVQLLLGRGADVNAQGGYFGNALYAASYSSHVEVVQLLLDRGADVNAEGGQYSNALQAASYSSEAEVVRLLLGKGVDVNAQKGRHMTALFRCPCRKTC
jgi:hypothetical protein